MKNPVIKFLASALLLLVLPSCVTTLQGSRIGSFRYGGTTVTLADTADLSFRRSGTYEYVKLTVNGLEGWYLIDPKSDFTLLTFDSPLLKSAVDPKTKAPWTDQGRAFDAAGFTVWDTGFYRAENFLVSVYRTSMPGAAYGPEGPVIGIIGREMFSGFRRDDTETSKGLLKLRKGNPESPAAVATPQVSLLLPGTAGDQEAKIWVNYYLPQYFASADSYFPPRMFVNLVGLKVLDRRDLTEIPGLTLKRFTLTLGSLPKFPNPIPGEYLLPASRLAAGDDLYTEAVKSAFRDSKLTTGWVLLKSITLREDQVVFTTEASGTRAEW